MKQFFNNNVRIQLFGGDIIRLEVSENGEFCDRKTFFVPDRREITEYPDIDTAFDGHRLAFGDYLLCLPESGIEGTVLLLRGKEIYRYERIKNSGELPKPIDTPEVFALCDSPRIPMPEKGYTVHQQSSEYKVIEGVEDIYLLLCDTDHEKLRRLYVALTGRCEMVRLSTLGSWNSKYYPYTQKEAEQVIIDYEKYGVPLDVLVIDTDWRFSENGWGYDINEKLFPDMEGFFKFSHEHGVEVMFNDHPEPKDGLSVFEKDEIAYREENLQKLLSMGLDIWWYDRNWHTHLISPTAELSWETLGLHIFGEITKHHFQKLSGDEKVYRRPVIMGNVNNIINGRYQGIDDSASHRYSIQWTGDCMSDEGALGQEVANIIKTGENCIGYAHPDCGGHQGNPDRALFVRWMQMGAFCPVLRPHCTCIVERFREPWLYDVEVLDIVRDYIKMRYRLLPLIYAQAFENYRTGAPIFASLGYNYPKDKKAAECYTQYMLGKNILIAPIVGKYPEPMPKSCYTKDVCVDFYNGTECEGEIINSARWDSLNMHLKHNSPADGVPMYDFSARIHTSVKFDRATELILTCDDGSTVWIDGKKVLEDKTFHGAKDFSLGILKAGITHSIEIEYFQGGGEATCSLLYKDAEDCTDSEIYFPEGMWLDAFDGRIYCDGRSRSRKCELREFPLFVRLGSLIPISCSAQNTHEQSWQSLTYHYYPDRNTSDRGIVYEDDGESTAYKYGRCRKSEYEAYFDSERLAYIIKLHKSEGEFEGSDAFDLRSVTLLIHKHGQMEDVDYITLNGEPVPYEIIDKDPGSMPFEFDGAAPDSDVLRVKFNAALCSDHTLEIHIK